MIKRIYCPTDFSTAANNAIEYAAKLAQASNATLKLLSIQPVFPVIETTAGLKEKTMVADLENTLEEISAEVSKTFNIFCDYELDITTKRFEKIIAEKSEETALIVMGTNGVDNDYQYFFGSNTYNVIKRSSCPILVIPDNVTYGTIQKIVFAWDYSTKSKISLSILKDYVAIFNPKITFLHISSDITQISKDVFTALRNEIDPEFENRSDYDFQQIFSENIPESIDDFVKSSQADLLAITFYHRGIIADIFHGKVAKELSEKAAYPILVINE
ncbi:MAG: universal stress protein [Bacteroidia bacterium]